MKTWQEDEMQRGYITQTDVSEVMQQSQKKYHDKRDQGNVAIGLLCCCWPLSAHASIAFPMTLPNHGENASHIDHQSLLHDALDLRSSFSLAS